MERTLTLAKWRKNRQKSQVSSPEIKLNGPNPTGAIMEREIEGDLEAKGPGNEEEQHSGYFLRQCGCRNLGRVRFKASMVSLLDTLSDSSPSLPGADQQSFQEMR